MAELNLLSITPHQVSRDLRGYSVFFYGEPKSGKTTIASKFPDALLLAFEKGYNALAGVMAQPINSWAEFIKVQRQLKDEKVKEKFSTIIIDTADIAYSYCEKYVCANNGVDTIADIGYGKGYALVGNEFDEKLRSIVQMDYGLVIISHATDKTFKNEAGVEYNQIVPTLGNKPRNIVSRMCDIIGYSRAVQDAEGKTSTKLFMRGTPRYVAGSRFKYTPDYIDFNYKSLVKAIGDAIDKQMEEDGSEYFTTERNNLYLNTREELNFDALMEEFNSIPETTKENKQIHGWGLPSVKDTVEKYNGTMECIREENEFTVSVMMFWEHLKTK